VSFALNPRPNRNGGMSSKIEEAMFYVARLNPYKNGNDDIVTPFTPALPFIGRLRKIGIPSLIHTVCHVG
jgi:hypothetical protein